MHIINLTLASLVFSNVEGFGWNSITTKITQRPNVRNLEMRKKGGKVPIDQRGDFIKRQKMMEGRDMMKKDLPTDVPVFELFVRPKVIWKRKL